MASSNPKRLAVLGATGSIGCQTLEVVRHLPDYLSIEVLTGQNNAGLLIKQAIEFLPNAVVIGNVALLETVRAALESYPIKVFAGPDALDQIVGFDSIDMVVNAIVGIHGLKPTISAIKHGKHIAMANKESMVIAGNLLYALSQEYKVNIFPVDSEHSAIFQCLVGELLNPIEKIYLTGSGGPFRGKDAAYLQQVSKEEALMHPNWHMGSKITIDSATLMNKGFEVIASGWYFGLSADQVQVIIHPQSIIHSVVQFTDGSMKAQMGFPDMKLPIQYALTFPRRYETASKRFHFMDYPELSFETPDMSTFPALLLAYQAMRRGGNMPCILCAANDMAVDAFLNDQIGFLDITAIIEQCLSHVHHIHEPTMDDIFQTDIQTRQFAQSLINQSTVTRF